MSLVVDRYLKYKRLVSELEGRYYARTEEKMFGGKNRTELQ